MILNLIQDASVGNAPAGFRAALNALVSFFDSTFTDTITVNIAVGYGEINGQTLSSDALASSLSNLQSVTYAQLRSDLFADAKSPDDNSAVTSLPAASPSGGTYWVTTAEAQALGLSNSNSLDGAIGFSTKTFDYDSSDGVTPDQYDFFGAAAHEITEVMGRQLLVGGNVGSFSNSYEPMDLFHFAAPGVRTFSGTQAGYFSLDKGVTNLDNFNSVAGADFGDWAASAGADAFLARTGAGVVSPVTPTDIRVMDVLGWDVSSGMTPTTIESAGSTTLTVSAGHFSLLDGTGAGPTLKFSGADFVSGQLGAWTPIGVEKIANGYEIAWQEPGSDHYTLWATDHDGNFTANLTGDVSGSNSAIVSSESLFQQDLNGDGQIGSPSTVMNPIESYGSTTLAASANRFYLLDSTGAGPTLKLAGDDFTSGQLGAWTPIGAEKIANGYEIAWQEPGSDHYTLWTTDNGGNFTANLTGDVSGSNSAIVSSESLFQQDLNGDGQIGSPSAVMNPIESAGSTTLATSANHFYLLDSTGAGPTLKLSGADFTSGQLGAWTPAGAEKIANGYEIAWQEPGSDHYTLWTTDHDGNFTANLTGDVSGSNSAIVASESLFQQDLNGDGHIGNAQAMMAAVNTVADTAHHDWIL
jgi:serralysin